MEAALKAGLTEGHPEGDNQKADGPVDLSGWPPLWPKGDGSFSAVQKRWYCGSVKPRLCKTGMGALSYLRWHYCVLVIVQKEEINLLMSAPEHGIFCPGVEKWHYLEGKIREYCRYMPIPRSDLLFLNIPNFLRVWGDNRYCSEGNVLFPGSGPKMLTLRPEATASTVRAYLENKLYAQPQPVKLYYLGPMFRYDRPQAGRYRQFYQFGVEVIGAEDPAADAEVILMAVHFFAHLGLGDLEVHLNSIGCPACRGAYRKELLNYLSEHIGNL